MDDGVRAPLRVRLLGHVALEIDGTPFTLASQRSTGPLLAYLLLHRGAPVARDALAYLLRPDETEEGARLSLRNNLYRLTRALPPAPEAPWLVSDVDSVRWNPAAQVWLDVDRFEAASRDPDRLEEAVELYRGDLLTTLYDEWMLEPRERFRNMYLATLTELVSRHRRARNLPRALGYAQQLLATEPFREDVLRRLIAIRHELGDRAGAMWEYQRFASRLRAELGIDPMPETVALRDAITRDEPLDTDEIAAVPSNLAPAALARELPFVGRQAELDQLFDAWSRALRQRGGCILIGGESGIGKSRLALEFARMAEERGGRILAGSTGTPEATPYQCLLEALRSVLPLVAGLRLGDVWLATLATLLPELRERIPNLPALPSVEPADERARLFEALARCFSALAKPRPLVIVLEDLQWAGESTLAALEYLLRRTSLLPILFIATYREDETTHAHPLRRLRRSAPADGVVRGLTLAPLTQADVAQLTRTLPDVEESVGALYATSDGNPLFLTQLIDVPLDELSAGGAGGLRGVVATRIDRCSTEARTIAEIAALVGAQFSRDVVVAVSGWKEATVLDALDELIEHRIVRETSGRGFFDYAFAHRIVAEVVVAASPPERTARRHRRIARALESLGSDRLGELSATIARQYDLAGAGDSAAPRYLVAARQALSVGAVDEAEALAVRGVALATELALSTDLLLVRETVANRRGDDRARATLLDQLDDAASALGDEELARALLLRRIEFAETAEDRDGEARAIAALGVLVGAGDDERWVGRLRNAEAGHAIELGRLDDGQGAADAALAAYRAAADPVGEAEARTNIAKIASLRGDLARAQTLLDAARLSTDRASDARLSMRLLRIWYGFAFARRDLQGCLDVARRLLETATASGDRRAEADGHVKIAVSLVSFGGRYADARAHLASATAIVTEIGDPVALAGVIAQTGQLDEILGDFVAAANAHQQYYEMTKTRAEPRRQVVALINLSSARALLGEVDVAKALARQGIERAREVGYAVLEASAVETLAMAEGMAGEYPAAIEHMERALAMRSETASSGWTGVTLASLARWYVNVGATAQARACIVRMFEAEDAIAQGTPWPQWCYWVAAQVYHACGDDGAAMKSLEQAHAVLKRLLERVDESDRAAYLALPWHAEMAAVAAGGEWPSPLR